MAFRGHMILQLTTVILWTSASLVQASSTCQVGWIEHRDNCFQLNENKMTWDGARGFCQSMGGDLATVPDQGTQYFVKRNFRGQDMWIGLKYKLQEGAFKWAYGNKTLSSSYRNWAPEPHDTLGIATANHGDQRDKNCVHLWKNKYYKWHVDGCHTEQGSLCERPVSRNNDPGNENCGTGWEYAPGTDYCYQFNNVSMDWMRAQASCMINGGNILSVTTPEEMLYLTGRMQSLEGDAFWSGGTDKSTDSGWVWADSKPFSFINWDVGQPNSNADDNCISVNRVSGRWSSLSCEAQMPTICKKLELTSPCQNLSDPPGNTINHPTPQPTVPPSNLPKDKVWGCPPKWRSFRGSCYAEFWESGGASWTTANQKCQAMFANLVAITDQKENDFVLSMIHRGLQSVWIGLNDFRRRYSFSWSDYVTPMTYTNWKAGQPAIRGMSKVCVGIRQQTGEWEDHDCNSMIYYYICKMNKNVRDKSEVNANNGCSKGGKGYFNKCYKFYARKSKTFRGAQRVCTSLGGNLATLNDIHTQAFVSSEILTSSHWIGLSNSQTSEYTWQSGEILDFVNWDRDHTGSETNTCVAIKSTRPVGLWHNYECMKSLPFVCEYPRPGYSTPQPLAATSMSVTQCAKGWFAVGHMCYRILVYSKKTWAEANAYCQSIVTNGGSLVSLTSAELETTLMKKLKAKLFSPTSSYKVWIGLNDRNSLEGYRWVGDEPFVYQNWDNGQPDNQGNREDCALWTIDNDIGHWVDSDCYQRFKFICQAPMGTQQQLLTTHKPPTAFPSAPNCGKKGSWTTFNGHCYMLSKAKTSKSATWSHHTKWFNAKNMCHEENAQLVSIVDPLENDFLTDWLKQNSVKNVWIGLNNFDEDVYKWVDGNPVTYLSWDNGQPDNSRGGERCVILNDKGYWRDERCNVHNKLYICKKKPGKSVTMPTEATPRGGCPVGFRGMPGTSRCFRVQGVVKEDRKDFFDAIKACGQLATRSRLASIHSTIDQEFVTTLIADLSAPAWIGFNDRYGEAEQFSLLSPRYFYHWVDNTAKDYVNWDRDSNGRDADRQCTEMVIKPNIAGEWATVDCMDTLPFVCEYDKSTTFRKVPSNTEGCPTGYYRFRDACYKYVQIGQNWMDSEAACAKDGGYLASLQGGFDNAFVDLLTQDNQHGRMWIGLTYHTGKEAYTWSDSWPVVYTSWDRYQPDVQKKCVSSMKGGRWRSTPCSQKLPSVCQIHLSEHPFKNPEVLGKCPSDIWTHSGDQCYFVEAEKMSWSSASAQCSSLGGQLASVHNEDHAKIIAMLLNLDGEDAWIGMQRSSPDSGFGWSDGTEVEFFNWAPGSPMTTNTSDGESNLNCVLAQGMDGRWSNTGCFDNLGYLCQAKHIPITMPAYATDTSAITEMSPTTPLTTGVMTDNTATPTLTTTFPSPSDLESTKSKISTGISGGSTHGMDHFHANSNNAKQTSSKSDDSGMSSSSVAGVVVGVLCFGVVIVAVGGFLFKRRHSYNSTNVNTTFKPDSGFHNAAYDANNDAVELKPNSSSSA